MLFREDGACCHLRVFALLREHLRQARSFGSVHKAFLAEFYIVFRLHLHREIKSHAKFVDEKTPYFMRSAIGSLSTGGFKCHLRFFSNCTGFSSWNGGTSRRGIEQAYESST
jgi:hypothetical protein